MKKWFKRITAGAVAAVVFGMALMPQGESRAAAARIQVSVPENRVPAYEQGETKTFVLEVKNNGPDELKNIKAVFYTHLDVYKRQLLHSPAEL